MIAALLLFAYSDRELLSGADRWLGSSAHAVTQIELMFSVRRRRRCTCCPRWPARWRRSCWRARQPSGCARMAPLPQMRLRSSSPGAMATKHKHNTRKDNALAAHWRRIEFAAASTLHTQQPRDHKWFQSDSSFCGNPSVVVPCERIGGSRSTLRADQACGNTSQILDLYVTLADRKAG